MLVYVQPGNPVFRACELRQLTGTTLLLDTLGDN